MNSRDKGKRGERQWRDELRANGYHARRGQQFSGSPESPDVVCEELKWAHMEVKATERFNLYDALDQAIRDAGLKHVPFVMHKRNFRRWVVVMEGDTFFRFLRGELPPPSSGECRVTSGESSTSPRPSPQSGEGVGAHGVTRPTKTNLAEGGGDATGNQSATEKPEQTEY